MTDDRNDARKELRELIALEVAERANCVRFEARGLAGGVSIRDLVKHALRHRPDHIVVGEVRGGEAADLLQALNTGHGGSLTTVHANNATSALSRIAACAMQGEGDLPWDVTCRSVVDGIQMVLHMTRRDGRRFVEEALFVEGYDAAENRWDVASISTGVRPYKLNVPCLPFLCPSARSWQFFPGSRP